MSLDRPEWLSAVVPRVRLVGSDVAGRVLVGGEVFSGFGYVGVGVDSYDVVRVVEGEVVEPVDDQLLGVGPFTDLLVQEEEPGWDGTAPDWWHRGRPFTGAAISFAGDRVVEVVQVEDGVPGDRLVFAESGAVVGCSVEQRVDPVVTGGVDLIRQSCRWTTVGEMRRCWTAFGLQPGGQVSGEVDLLDSGELRLAGATGGYFDAVARHRDVLRLPVLDDWGLVGEIVGVGEHLRLRLGDRSEQLVDRLVSGCGLGGVERLSVIVYAGGLAGFARLVDGELPSLRSLKVVPDPAVDEMAAFELLLGLKRQWGSGVEVGLDSWKLQGVWELPVRGAPGYGLYFGEGFEELVGVVGVIQPERWPELAAWVEGSLTLRFVKATLPGDLTRPEIRELLDRLSSRSEVTVIGPEVRPHEWVPEAVQRFAP